MKVETCIYTLTNLTRRTFAALRLGTATKAVCSRDRKILERCIGAVQSKDCRPKSHDFGYEPRSLGLPTLTLEPRGAKLFARSLSLRVQHGHYHSPKASLSLAAGVTLTRRRRPHSPKAVTRRRRPHSVRSTARHSVLRTVTAVPILTRRHAELLLKAAAEMRRF